jgi:hypothetical protein
MEVEYSLTPDDLEALQQHFRGEKPRTQSGIRNFQWQWVVILAVLLVFLVLSATRKGELLDRAVSFLAPTVWFVLAVCVGMLLMWLALLWQRKVNFRLVKQYHEDKHNRWTFEPQRLRIDPQGLTSTCAYQQTTLRWPVVWKIDATEDHAFLYSTSTSATVIPRRAFRDQQHFEEFAALARQYQQDAKLTGIIASGSLEATAVTRPHTP